MNMIERVARALWWDTPEEQIEAMISKGAQPSTLAQFIPMARIAIEAMREPGHDRRRAQTVRPASRLIPGLLASPYVLL